MSDKAICVSSASIKPEWVARWGFQRPPCETVKAGVISDFLSRHSKSRQQWNDGEFQLELLPGFGPDGPLAKVAPVERKLAPGWKDAVKSVAATYGARCSGPDNHTCPSIPRWLESTGYWYCYAHAEERGAFAVSDDAQCEAWCGVGRPPTGCRFWFTPDRRYKCSQACFDRLKDLGDAAERHGLKAPGSVNETTQAPSRQGVNPGAGGQAAVTCKAPGWCSTACWRVQRHVEEAVKVKEPWKAPLRDHAKTEYGYVLAAAEDTVHSLVAALPPRPLDTATTLAHHVPRWATPKYERKSK